MLAGAAVFAETADMVAGQAEGRGLAARLRAYEIILYPPDWLLRKVKRPLPFEALAVEQTGPDAESALFIFSLGYSLLTDPDHGVENDRCRQLLTDSLTMFEAVASADRAALVHYVLAGRLNQIGDGTVALGHLQASLGYYQQEQDGWAEARTLQRLGRTSYGMGDFEGAADYFSRCRNLNEAVGFRPGLAYATRWLGNVAFSRGQYDQAHARYLQALELEQEAGDPYQIGRIYNNLGAASKRMGEFEQAEHWYQQSLTVFKRVDEIGLAAMVYNNLGLLHEELGHYEEALTLVEKGLQMRLASGGRLAAASDYINLGSILSALGEDEKATIQLLQALELALESGREAHIIEALTVLAQVHALQARPEQAAHLASLTLSHPAAEHQTIERAKSLLGSLPDINPVTFDPAGLIELAYSELKFWVEAS
jgi:tetratricopeptide (TPR) repeat protein